MLWLPTDGRPESKSFRLVLSLPLVWTPFPCVPNLVELIRIPVQASWVFSPPLRYDVGVFAPAEARLRAPHVQSLPSTQGSGLGVLSDWRREACGHVWNDST